MEDEVRWERVEYECRIDALADEVPEFVDAVLGSIDYEAARRSPQLWAIVRVFFAGCADAARVQQSALGRDGEQVKCYFEAVFSHPGADDGSPLARGIALIAERDGFYEFMDWLSNPDGYRPTRLRQLLVRRATGGNRG